MRTNIRLIRLSAGLLCLLVIMLACNQRPANPIKSDTEAWDSVKLSSYHYDYLRFMINHTDSRHFDSALVRYFRFQHMLFDTAGWPQWDCFSRCISVEIYKDTLLFEGEPVNIKELKEKSLSYLINKNNDEFMPGQKSVKDKNGTVRIVSDGFFYIQTDLQSNTILKQCIKELKASYHDYKDYLAGNWYRQRFDELSPEKREIIDHLVIDAYELWLHVEFIIIREDSATDI